MRYNLYIPDSRNREANRMMNQIKAWLQQLVRRWPELRRSTFSTALGTLQVVFPCALILYLMNFVEALGERYAWMEGAGAFWSLVDSVLVMPLAAGMITYAAAAIWEHRSAGLNDAVQLVRIRVKQVLITGVAAGVLIWLFRWVSSTVSSIIGILPALLGWIPLIGTIISGIVSFVIWLVALAMEYIAHCALVAGMLALTADGMSGRPQAERAISLIWGGRDHTLHDLALVFGGWIILGAVQWALGSLPGVLGPLVGSLLPTVLYALSTVAVSVIYLTERDRQEGMRYHG